MEEEVVKGKIIGIETKKTVKGNTYYKLDIDGKKRNYFRDNGSKLKVDDVVELTLQKEGEYWNIKMLDVVNGSQNSKIPIEDLSEVDVSGKGEIQSPEDRRQTLIVRQSSINYACQLAGVFYGWRKADKKEEEKIIDLVYMKEQVLQLAGEIERWVTRK